MPVGLDGAQGGSRTLNPVRGHDFESCAYASSATWALKKVKPRKAFRSSNKSYRICWEMSKCCFQPRCQGRVVSSIIILFYGPSDIDCQPEGRSRKDHHGYQFRRSLSRAGQVCFAYRS